MKIEIELGEVENLRRNVDELWRENLELKDKLDSISEENLIQQASSLAARLFHEYLLMVFEKLGFTNKENWRYHGLALDSSELKRHLGTAWHEQPENVFVELGVSMTNNWKSAFMSIGVSRDFLDKKDSNKKELAIDAPVPKA